MFIIDMVDVVSLVFLVFYIVIDLFILSDVNYSCYFEGFLFFGIF